MDYFPLRLEYKSNILEFSVFSILVNYNTHLMYITHLFVGFLCYIYENGLCNMALKIQGIVQGLNLTVFQGVYSFIVWATDIQFETYSAYFKCRRNHPNFNYL